MFVEMTFQPSILDVVEDETPIQGLHVVLCTEITGITNGSLVQSFGQGSKASTTKTVHSFQGDLAFQTGLDVATST